MKFNSADKFILLFPTRIFLDDQNRILPVYFVIKDVIWKELYKFSIFFLSVKITEEKVV